ncbi:hypothetical protein CVCC1112_1738 [Paenarthrobacter nicotinovorans]|nr:hypothetical protein CVCC1112_1738 [Paenarthrobacter nicotinovorans]
MQNRFAPDSDWQDGHVSSSLVIAMARGVPDRVKSKGRTGLPVRPLWKPALQPISVG